MNDNSCHQFYIRHTDPEVDVCFVDLYSLLSLVLLGIKKEHLNSKTSSLGVGPLALERGSSKTNEDSHQASRYRPTSIRLTVTGMACARESCGLYPVTPGCWYMLREPGSAGARGSLPCDPPLCAEPPDGMAWLFLLKTRG